LQVYYVYNSIVQYVRINSFTVYFDIIQYLRPYPCFFYRNLDAFVAEHSKERVVEMCRRLVSWA